MIFVSQYCGQRAEYVPLADSLLRICVIWGKKLFLNRSVLTLRLLHNRAELLFHAVQLNDFMTLAQMSCRLGTSSLATIQAQDLVVLFSCHVLIPPDWMLSTVIATLTGCQWLMSSSVWDNWFHSLSVPVWERTNLLSWCVRVCYLWGWLSVCVCLYMCVCMFTACFGDGLQH